MRAFITGSNRGQLHWELLRSCPPDTEIVSVEPRLDLYDAQAISATLKELKPDVIINAAAYTAVDKAESESEKAMALNAEAVMQPALGAQELNAKYDSCVY